MADLDTQEVLKKDIPWETYVTAKLITARCLTLLRRYDKRLESQRAALLDDEGPDYIRVFVNILQNINKEDTVEYVLALIDEMLTANPKRARLFHEKSLAREDTYEPFLNYCGALIGSFKKRVVKYSRLLSGSISYSNGEASNLESKFTTIDDVLKGLVEWLCAQLRKPTHPTRGVQTAVNSLATLLREPFVRTQFVQADGIKLLIPLIAPASTQQSIQLLYEACLCVWLLSFYDAAIDYLATTRILPRLVDVIKGSTKEKVGESFLDVLFIEGSYVTSEDGPLVVRVIILTLKNFLSKGSFGAQMVDLGLPQIVQNIKAQAWTDEDLVEAAGQLEEGLREKVRKLSSFEKYKQEVLLGHLEWSPMHKDPNFWRENITNFEENDFQIIRVLLTILDTSSDPTALAVACHDIAQFVQYHPGGRIVLADLGVKERVMKLMNHDSPDVMKNALLCTQRLFLGTKYASFLQPSSS